MTRIKFYSLIGIEAKQIISVHKPVVGYGIALLQTLLIEF